MKKYVSLILAIPMFIACSSNSGKSDAYGNFEAVEVLVSAESAGRLLSFPIDVGMDLKEGQKVGLIDSTQAYLRYNQLLASRNAAYSKLASAQAQLRAGQVQLNVLQKEKNRMSKLYADSAATQQQNDDITGKYDVASAQFEASKMQVQAVSAEIEVLESQIRQAKDLLTKCSISNPIDGTVLERFSDQGELVGPGVPLYKIADLSSLNLRAYISETQLPSIKISDSIDVMIDNGQKDGKYLAGQIIWVSSQAEFTPKIIQTKEERVNLVYAIKIKVKNNGSIKIGMPGEIRFRTKTK